MDQFEKLLEARLKQLGSSPELIIKRLLQEELRDLGIESRSLSVSLVGRVVKITAPVAIKNHILIKQDYYLGIINQEKVFKDARYQFSEIL